MNGEMDMHDGHDDADPTPAKSPATTLDQIREGGIMLVALTRSRLAECERAVFDGRFGDALQHLQEAMQKLGPLAQAEASLGGFAESEIVRAEEIVQGMVLRNLGTVCDVRREERPVPGDDEPCVHIHLTFVEEGLEDAEIHAEQEIVVVRATDWGHG